MAMILAQNGPIESAAKSWADVARRAASALQAPQQPTPQQPTADVKMKARPWRDFSSSSASRPPIGKHAARPWKEVAQRMASAFEKGAVEADDSEVEPHSAGETEPSAGLNVGPRGSKRVFCFGEVLVMLGHYGWLMPYEDIDHPAAQTNGGHVYVHWRDISRGNPLAKGDRVSFYLYADEQGLGAEDCQLQDCFRAHDGWTTPTWPAPPSGLNPEAADFVPGAWRSTEKPTPCATIVPPLNVLAVNLDYWTDDDSDSSEAEASESGVDSSDCAARHDRLKTKPSSRGTASTGVSSDSDSSSRRRCRRRQKPVVMMVTPPSAPPPGLAPVLPPGLTPSVRAVAPPPGLVAPPPGLELPNLLISSPPGL